MDKQQAIDFIFEKLDQGESTAAIVSALSGQLNAPQEMTARFVAQVERQYWAVKPPPAPEIPPEAESQPPTVKLPPWLQDQVVPADKEHPAAYALPGSLPAAAVKSPVSLAAPQTAAPQAPPARVGGKPRPEAFSDPALKEMIKRELGRGRKRSDVVMAVCERSGAAWNEAQRFVNQVAIENRGRINLRRNILVFPLSLGAIAVGLVMAFFSAAMMVALLSAQLHFESPLAHQLTGGDLQNAPIVFFIGMAMIAGGVIGLINGIRSSMQ